MGGVHERKQITHRDGYNARGLQRGGRLTHRVLIQRLKLSAAVIDAPADLMSETLRRDGRRLLVEIIERVAVACLALRLLHGPKAPVDQEPNLRAAHLQKRVGGDRGAVRKKLDG